jgi:hypothetical protein
MPYADPAQQARYQREWAARRRAEWFTGKRCAWCGDTDDLELDHKNALAKASHRIWSWAQARREAELAKCQVLCHYCHETKTELLAENASKATGYRHGTRAMYCVHRCHCDLCRAWNRNRARARRARM